MKYEKEYKNTKSRNEFVSVCSKKYKGIKKQTLIRRYYDLRKVLGDNKKKINWKPNGVDYDKIFEHSKNYKDFAERVLNVYSGMTYQSAVRRYYSTRDKINKYKNVVPQQILYTPPPDTQENIQDEEQDSLVTEKPGYIKLLEIKDITRLYGKQLKRSFLRRYGFNELEINWLEQEGIINASGREW